MSHNYFSYEEKYSLLDTELSQCYKTAMEATQYSSNALEMFYGSIKDEENVNLPQALQPNMDEREPFIDFVEWLRVRKMNVPKYYKFNSDVFVFAKKKIKVY